MGKIFSKAVSASLAGASAALLALAVSSNVASAQSTEVTAATTHKSDKYHPGVWLDPDGCEHWVMDDGVEGYGTNRLTRQGLPVCHDVNVCGVMNTDQLFATDSHRVSASGKNRLRSFFQSANAFGYTIVGHTDSRASDEYNMRLSYNRANSVAAIGNSVGARIIDVRGYGERMPVASNGSAAGMQQNRRVEILCFK